MRRWSIDSQSFLHIQNLLTTQISLFLKLSKVRILPFAAVQVKKATLVGAFTFQILFQGKG